MKPINPVLMEFFHRSAVSKLPPKKREIYQFFESKENQLEEISENEQQFLKLMIARSPYKEAAEQFSLDISTIKKIMDEAQAEIENVIKQRSDRLKWIECSNREKSQSNSQWSFIFVS